MKKIERGLFSLARLLQLGFGEAGASVISRSLATGAMTALATNRPGSIVNAFFGFCDIRNFTFLTEQLQADVVKLVNSVARLLHDCVIRSHGDPNKNIGDAFLGDRCRRWRPYVECILEMSRDERLSQHINLEAAQEVLKDGHMRMGFGLHFGWAVECVIGSKHKVDVSYLSPHVNMSSRLEAATKQYGVSILMSGDVVGLLSWDIKRLCRLIDRVTVKGSSSPIDLYTFDEPSMQSRGGTVPDDIDFSSLQSSRAFFEVAAPSTDAEFRRDFSRAISVYLGGPDGSKANWECAMQRLRDCLRKRPGDGPTLAILQYMEEEMAKPEESRVRWMGYRMLEHK
ncbi:hypothetical protein GUITHDRAFT_90376 [Guillardia theta CCMP2712]|uniref:Guanylate cyclase domain-containing protein n=1 Tax=Guillardia theta (strain CCMP2712) TaxID=905079 RepID=L1IFX5_GUITC|nr:hypothetical protein GUITHDRAFT_90376 [Guillardia theta CCMP2712]EKX34735.1 hypothetical protein GUITHDRAFT_90376 [Guillardia theta CCMP2712]|eukprot:XP_005821715.1 hypothetical protein GUITHDRAFT_90376 [Guillardia theta CCMP2712]